MNEIRVASTSSKTAVDRLKARIAARIDSDRHRERAVRYSQVGLAAKIGINKSTLNELLNGPSSKRGLLTHLDAIADYLNLSPAELVKGERSKLMELSVAEQQIVQQWRDWPREIRAAVLRLFDHFGGLLPEEQEAREYGYLFRQLRHPQLRADAMNTLRDAVNSQPRFRPNALTSVAEPDRTAETPRSAHARQKSQG